MPHPEKKEIRLSNLIDDWNVKARILYVFVRLTLVMIRLLPDKGKDGWRRTTEAHHRNDEAKYIGSLHNLAPDLNPSLAKKEAREKITERLYQVFKEVPDLHYALRWKRNACMRIPHKFCDLMEVSYHETGRINELLFFPDKDHPVPETLTMDIISILLEELKAAYNQTCLLLDKKRSLKLYRKLHDTAHKKVTAIPGTELEVILFRMLGATWINFREEETDAGSRRSPHFFTHQKQSGFGVLNIHCKYAPDLTWLDIWMQFSHIAIDGRAAAKLQGKIYNAFDLFENNLVFPGDFRFRERHFIYKYPDRDVFHGCSFVDLGPLLAIRDRLREERGNILPVALLIWGLAHHPLFKGVKFNVPVDIPADGQKERSVGFVFIKPESFTKASGREEAFGAYLASFDRQVRGIRRRRIENYDFMQTSIMASHGMLTMMLKYLSAGLFAFTGTTCVTFMDNIEYAIPSLSDNIQTIIAVSLIHRDNNTTACVALRSKTDTAKQILRALDEVIENIPALFEADLHQ